MELMGIMGDGEYITQNKIPLWRFFLIKLAVGKI